MSDSPQSLAPVNPVNNWPCKVWMGQRNKAGYGTFTTSRRLGKPPTTKLVHRVIWEIHNGPIPEGMKVCHACDNPPCAEPTHLWLGTQADNLADMKAKGRDNRGCGGRRFGTDRTIREAVIRDRRPAGVVAAELGINRATVSRWRQAAGAAKIYRGKARP